MTASSFVTRHGEPVPEAALSAFAEAMGGALIRPGAADYEAARHIWNSLIERHPGAILRARGTADVVAGVRFAAAQGCALAVRGGGHNVGGRALCDGGLVIDLSQMRGIHVDPHQAEVRVQGGATLGDVDRETHLHGLAVPLGVISRTGVGGLTLGGGVGWLVRRYGPSCDAVLEMEVVLADGQVVRANAEDHPDLYWGLRGGGGNFGVVTSFLYRAYPVSTVLGGLIVYARADAEQVLRGYRDVMAHAPEELTVYCGLIWTPDGTPATAVIPCWSGADLEAGRRAIAPLMELAPSLMVAVEAMPFPAMQSMLDGAFPEGTRNYWKSAFVPGLSDEAIAVIVAQAQGMTGPLSALLVEYYGGASGRRGAETNAFAQRHSDYCVGFMPQWTDPAADLTHIAWARTAWEAIQPFATGGYLLNYLAEGEEDAVRGAFGAHYPRLQQIKKRYDPTNLFRINQNIEPAA